MEYAVGVRRDRVSPDRQPAGGRSCPGARSIAGRELLPLSRSKTMCLPTRWTRSMRRPGSSFAISWGEDLKGSGFPLNQVVSMRSPRRRSSTPRAMVSTSGSSGMAIFCHCRRCLAETVRRYIIKSRNRLRRSRQTGSAIFPLHPCAGLKKFDQEAEPAGEECVTRN